MMCNKKTIPEFTPEQIAECKKCIHASGKKIWCCLLGVDIGKPTILTPSKEIIKPFPKNEREYNRGRFQRDYAVAAELNKGQEIISETDFVKHRQTCATCPAEDKIGCDCVGCKQWDKLILKKTKCPKGKFEIVNRIEV